MQIVWKEFKTGWMGRKRALHLIKGALSREYAVLGQFL